MRDSMNACHPLVAIPPGAAVTDNTPLVGSVIDVLGYDSLTFAVQVGSLADADATFAVTVEHGNAANLSDAVPVPAEQLVGTLALAGFTFADSYKTRKVGYVGSKRYVRLTVTPANNAGAAYIAAVAVLSGAHQEPTPNPPV